MLEDELRLCAAKAGFKLKKSVVAGVPEIEVFFDLYYGGKKICYLLNLWNSPMLRLGANIKLRKDYKDIQERFSRVHHICGLHHISLLYPPASPKESVIKVSLETAVYLGNISAHVLSEAVHRFAQCSELLRPLLVGR